MSSPDHQTHQQPADEDDYNSASDEDFDPEAPQQLDEDAESSASDDEPVSGEKRGKKRQSTAQNLDFDNSGDEATLARAKRKKRKSGPEAPYHSDDEGGEGGLVKTRAQRKAEIQHKKPLVQAGKASVDVDALWAQMSRPQNLTSTTPAEPTQSDAGDQQHASSNDNVERDTKESLSHTSHHQPVSQASTDEPTVTIKRSYEFAGQIMQEEKTVPASSAEAKLYLGEQAQKAATTSSTLDKAKPPLRRPKKRASMLDNPSAFGLDSKGPKLNTLQKSKLDWAAHVDQEGISDELDVHRRAKDGYLGRMDFLGRMESKREDDLRNIRSK